jgi:glycosyltransferase involved in cell wall biosynthesis
MRICLFTESYYTGGLDTFIINLINHWPDDNDQITLICNESHPGLEIIRKRVNRPGLSIKGHSVFMSNDVEARFKKRFGINIISKTFFFVAKYFIFLNNIFSLKAIIGNGDFDQLIVINGGYPAGFSCRAATICWGIYKKGKSVHNFHNFATTPRPLMKYIENGIDHLVQKHTSYFITVSQTCSFSMQTRDKIKNHEGINFVYNGIETDLKSDRFKDIRDELHLSPDSKICLLLATYEERKGHKFLIDVFEKVVKYDSDAYLICCGFGTEEEINSIHSYVSEKGLSSKIFIFNYREDVIDILRGSDILLISSKEFESFGLTAIEAMKNKIPVVSTNTGGLKEVIKEGEGGYLFNYGDTDNYANKVLDLLKDKGLRKEQGILGYNRFISHFTAEVMAKKYHQLLNK